MASQQTPKPSVDEAPVTIKISYDGQTRRHKLTLRDVGPATLELKIREFLDLPVDADLVIERYSDSANAYITLDAKNTAVYKQLYRAAKAKQKLKLRATRTDSATEEEMSSATSKPEALEDNSSSPSQASGKPQTLFDVLLSAEPDARADSKHLPTTDTGMDFETSLLASLMKRQTLSDPLSPESNPKAAFATDVPAVHGQLGRDQWFPNASGTGSGIDFCPARMPGSLNFAVCCNACDKNIPDCHYHCSTCDDGDFDLCQSCVNQGVTCFSSDHWLIKRVVKDGQIITSTTETIAPRSKKEEEEAKPSPKPTSYDASTFQSTFSEQCPVISSSSFKIRTCNCCVIDLPEDKFLHCTTCEDFDLCHSCFAKDGHGHHPQHAFVPAVEGAYTPNHIKIRLTPGRNRMHNAICDGCDNYISGVRHKCLDCPDWDYCGDCVLNARLIHPDHRFAPIYEPLKEARTRAQACQTHVGIFCDGPLCGNSTTYIRGVRYKCTICHDTDFCANCEASPASAHNKTHPLIKFRTPVRHCTVATHAERGDGYKLSQMGDRTQSTTSSRAADSTAIASVQTVVDVKPIEVPQAVMVEEKPVKEEAIKDEVVEEKAIIRESDIQQPDEPTSTPVEPRASDFVAVFVHDTVSDGTIFPSNHVFQQTWTLRNEGDVAWPAGCAVKFVGGDYMGHVDSSQPAGISELVSAHESTICYEPLAPGQEFPFTVLLRTPDRAGQFISYWRLTSQDGMKFGHRLWCDVKVKSSTSEAESHVPEDKCKSVNETAAKAEVDVEIQSSQMIFPKLEKESPESSMHQDAKSETAVSGNTGMFKGQEAEVDDFEDCGEANEWDGSDDGFMTDEEYDVLDASDEEYLEEQQKRLRQ